MNALLRAHLKPAIHRHRQIQLGGRLAGCWGGAALLGLGLLLLQPDSGWGSHRAFLLLALTAAAVAVFLVVQHLRTRPDWRGIARQIERRNPDLDGRLLTAVQQEPPPQESLNFLQQRLLHETIDHCHDHDWTGSIPRTQVVLTHLAQLGTLALFLAVLWDLRPAQPQKLIGRWIGPTLTVTPGDVSLERGDSLVVLARFGGALPHNTELVIDPSQATTRRIPLVKSLDDPVFGTSVPDVTNALTYRVEYDGHPSRDFHVSVYEHPRLDRADAELTYPTYTGLAPKRIENTRRLSAVEGSRLDLNLQFNKPVASAQLVSRDQDRQTVPLALVSNQPAAVLPHFVLRQSRTYALELRDAEGRTNKIPALFVFDALTNRTPEVRLTSPAGDLRPSALEELAFAGTAWDDFGLQAFGIGYTLAGQETQFIELDRSVPAREKRPFQHLIRLEDLGVKVNQFLSWFTWADDLGPDGAVRRTTGDLFFAEVRPFDEIFREGQSSSRQNQEEQPEDSSEEQRPSAARLAELQKQIISATWKLQRDSAHSGQVSPPPKSYAQDAGVVRDSQTQALDQAKQSRERVSEPRTAALWDTVTRPMEQAQSRLQEAVRNPAPLPQALKAEQEAYQALLQLQDREFQVSRARNSGSRSTSRDRQMQRQLDQLDLTQAEDRYETERQAKAPQSPERQGQLQVLNRLQELARRQQAVNEQFRELQTALQEARTDQQREEIRRRLKRLQEEEQQMLADLDELRQRMERPDLQSRLAEQRRQLEETRQEIQRAEEAARQGAASQALAAGSRAQRQLQQLRDNLRQENSSEFADDLRQMRADARDLARRQEDAARKLDTLADPKRKTLSDTDEEKALLDQLAQQKGRLTNLVERVTQLSQQTESAEPLVSRQLYDTLRQFTQEDAATLKEFQEELLNRGLMNRSLYDRLQETQTKDKARSLELTSEMLRRRYLPLADQAEARARSGMNQLRQGVEQAAEKVLGDDTEALRQAREELERLTAQLEREIAQASGQPGQPTGQTNLGTTRAAASTNAPTSPTSGERQVAQSTTNRSPTQTAQTRAEGSPRSSNTTRDSTPGPNEQPTSADARAESQPGQNEPSERASTQSNPNAPSEPRANRETATANRPTQPGRSPVASNQPTPPNQPGPTREPSDRDGYRWTTQLDSLLNRDGPGGTGPITGEEFNRWSDRLREVEEMVELPDLRSELAIARERAREVRRDFKRDLKKPDWAVVKLQVVRPLVEVRNQITEELARREPKDQLVPIDRDPVPSRYADLVRRYYQDLGNAR